VTGYTSLAALLFFIGFMAETVVVQSVLSDSVDKRQLDQSFGLYFTIGFTISSISSAIFGYIVEIFSFYAGFTFIAAVIAVSMIPAFFIQDPRRRGPHHLGYGISHPLNPILTTYSM